jgi:transcriptional regulator with XRE-family HTH domain
MHPMPRSTLGDNLRRLRLLREWSQEELAERSGVHRTIIGKVEAGLQEGASTDTIDALARALGVLPGDLVNPLGESPITELIPELEQSRMLMPPLSDNERAWLLSLPRAVWIGREPNAASLFHMVQARRSGEPLSE